MDDISQNDSDKLSILCIYKSLLLNQSVKLYGKNLYMHSANLIYRSRGVLLMYLLDLVNALENNQSTGYATILTWLRRKKLKDVKSFDSYRNCVIFCCR